MRHIAWDIGAADLCRLLAQQLDAVFIRQTYSRLVIDCNRHADNPQLIVGTSDGVAVPGNLGLSPEAVEQRLAQIYRPYHDRIAEVLRARQATGRRHVLVLLHSFTPRMNGLERPWRFGVLHLHNSPLSFAALRRLRAELSVSEVGDNEPYAMDGTDYTAPRHAAESGFDYLELEVRQDLIADATGQRQVALLLAPLLQDISGGPSSPPPA